MPCFKGIAVSIHANGAPLPEYGLQRQSRLSRISNYIPVPQPSLSGETKKPEPAKFAISITLLTAGLAIPYSAPKPSERNPYPKPQFVGLPHTSSSGGERGGFSGTVTPYIPITSSEHETIAAYIYFDGRAKEEVATLLRPGEETWVNSRWVQVPESEGGGLAEREFLFREVGLERWLNGLDLQGHDAAEKLERRRQKFEKRQRRQNMTTDGGNASKSPTGHKDTLRYGTDDTSPIEVVFDSDSWSDDDDPPEATGQIKVSMFRVLASGEIKKGEYSPQFSAHDGDDESGVTADNGINADVEHTTSFAKPKTLDPKTISTQTVTGIDGPEKPYAIFTFFYRGERQLHKIGVIQPPKNYLATPGSAKRRSGQLEFLNLGPLKAGGTVGFTAFRDQDSEAVRRRKARKKSNGNIADDSEDDDDDYDDDDYDDTRNGQILGRLEDVDDKEGNGQLTNNDAKFGGELADGVNRIRLKRAHSNDAESDSTLEACQRIIGDESPTAQGAPAHQPQGPAQGIQDLMAALVGSPLKKARQSIDQASAGHKHAAVKSLRDALDAQASQSAEASTITTAECNTSTTEAALTVTTAKTAETTAQIREEEEL